MAGQHYCLRWNNYQSNMTSVFHELLQTESFVDVTLSCNDSSLKAHKVVLSACSSYFQKLLKQNPCNHPTIIMPQDVSFSDLKVIIDFVYRGEIDVDQAQLQSLLKTADQLKIKGLCEVSDSKETNEQEQFIHQGKPSQVNIIQGDYNSHQTGYKTFSFDHVLASPPPSSSSSISFKNTFLSDFQLHRAKQNISPDHFVSLKHYPETNRLSLYQQSEQQNRRLATKRKLSPSCTITGRASPVQNKKKIIEIKKLVLKDTGVQSDNIITGMSLHDNNVSNNTNSTTNNISDTMRHEPQVWRWIHSNGERVPECITVATSTDDEEKNLPVVILERSMGTMPMIVHNMPSASVSPHLQAEGNSNHSSVHNAGADTPPDVDIPPEAQPAAPSATLVENLDLTEQHNDADVNTERDEDDDGDANDDVKVKFETLRSVDQNDTVDIDSHVSERNSEESDHSMQTMMITPELLGILPSSSDSDDMKGAKGWSQEDMELALDALRNHNMSLTRASATYGIPSTTLWQRAHRLGIDTPKKEGNTKNWTEDNLNNALEALRTGTISANKASKAFGIPSSTLYKIARREGIRLAAPFNAAPTAWTQDDLDKALESIRSGQTSVQRASTEYGIPTGTLYGRCKREGIELSRSNPTPWSEDAMGEALEAVRVGQMSINQAAIHYNLPYSSLYGRFKRGKFDSDDLSAEGSPNSHMMVVHYDQDLNQYHQHPGS